jgi:nucleotide sugar dehydrogenase
MTSINGKLVEGEPVGIHGQGFIGTSTAMAFAHEGIRSICYDIDAEKVQLYQSGRCNVMNLERWSMMELKPFINSKIIQPTNKLDDLENCKVHFVAVPTEKGGKPYINYVESVLDNIEEVSPNHELIIIESTLSPKWIKKLNLENRKVCIAPRRDWFADPNHTMKNLVRIYAGSSPDIESRAYEVLSIVCNHLEKAPSMKIACLTKAVENALWFIQLVSVQQLTMGYDDINVNELLRLVASHPRLNHYYPSIKIGGYCVPLGAEYVIQGSHKQLQMELFEKALLYNQKLPSLIAQKINIKHNRGANIGIMGVTYKNDLKVHTLSAVFDLITELPYHSIQIHDPYYTNAEIKALFNTKRFGYPTDLSNFDILIILTDHNQYYETPLKTILNNVKPDAFIIDNFGVWKRHGPHMKDYHIFGDGTF